MMAMLSCNKPHPNIIEAHKASPIAAVFSTSLADSLPQKTFEALKIGSITGVKIVNLEGMDVRYFEYKVDADVLLSALSDSAFSIGSKITDTKCRKISRDDFGRLLANVTDAERAYSHAMLNKEGKDFEFYACLKSPVNHFVVVNRFEGKVWHRIVRDV